MSLVNIDDLDCPYCKEITIGELDIKKGKYFCLKCGKEV